MTLGRLAFIAYALFLAAYAWYKYTVAAPAAFSADYAQSVIILVALTGIAPFVLSFAGLKLIRARGVSGVVIGLALGLISCVAGYALFWWFFLSATSGAPAVYDVAPRGIGWGLLLGGFASAATGHRRS